MELIIILLIVAVIWYTLFLSKYKDIFYFKILYPIKKSYIKQKIKNRLYERESQATLKNIHQTYGIDDMSNQGFLQYIQYEEDIIYFREQLQRLTENILKYISYTNTRIKQKDIYRLNKVRQLLSACGKIQKQKFKDSDGSPLNFPYIRIEKNGMIYPTLYHFATEKGYKPGYIENDVTIENSWDLKTISYMNNVPTFLGYNKKMYHDSTTNIAFDLDTGDLANYGIKGILHLDNEMSKKIWNDYIGEKSIEKTLTHKEWITYINSELKIAKYGK